MTRRPDGKSRKQHGHRDLAEERGGRDSYQSAPAEAVSTSNHASSPNSVAVTAATGIRRITRGSNRGRDCTHGRARQGQRRIPQWSRRGNVAPGRTEPRAVRAATLGLACTDGGDGIADSVGIRITELDATPRQNEAQAKRKPSCVMWGRCGLGGRAECVNRLDLSRDGPFFACLLGNGQYVAGLSLTL